MIDYDNDGLLDLFVCNYVRWSRKIDLEQGFKIDGKQRAYGRPTAFGGTLPVLYHNQGNGKFVDVTEDFGVGDFANSMGVATGDVDNDGTTEIYVANMFSKMGRRIIAHVCADDYPEGVYEGIQGACAGSHLYLYSDSYCADSCEDQKYK